MGICAFCRAEGIITLCTQPGCGRHVRAAKARFLGVHDASSFSATSAHRLFKEVMPEHPKMYWLQTLGFRGLGFRGLGFRA